MACKPPDTKIAQNSLKKGLRNLVFFCRLKVYFGRNVKRDKIKGIQINSEESRNEKKK